jgi:hypothetical protein
LMHVTMIISCLCQVSLMIINGEFHLTDKKV